MAPTATLSDPTGPRIGRTDKREIHGAGERNACKVTTVASRSITITYVPADCGSMLPGKSKAPQAFKDVDIAGRLKAAGVPSVAEREALDAPANYAPVPPSPGGVRNEDLNVAVCERVREALARNLGDGRGEPDFQLILGGECCMSPGIVTAFWEHAAAASPSRRVGFMYIDADADLYAPHGADSIGTFAGMNMTHLLRAPGALARMEQFSRPSGEPVCDAANTVFFGTNLPLVGQSPAQLAYLFDNGFRVVSATSVAVDPEERARQALRWLEDRVDVILVHLDVDAIDPRLFPLANVPNFTGVTFEQAMCALRAFLASEKVAALTVAEVNPDHDPGLTMTSRLTGELVAMLGAR